MLGRGRAKKLSVYVNEASHWHGKPVYSAIIELLRAKGLAGGTVVRAMAGFTRSGGIVTMKILDLSTNLPLKVEVVDTEEAIQSVLPDVYLMVDEGLVTVEDVDVVKYTGEPPAGGLRTERPRKVTMKAKQLSIHISEKHSYHGEPLYEAILKRFNLEEFAGATVYRALEGFGPHHRIHRDRRFALHHEAPIIMIMIDTEEHVARAREILDGMLDHGAVVVSEVEVTFYRPAGEPGEQRKTEGP